MYIYAVRALRFEFLSVMLFGVVSDVLNTRRSFGICLKIDKRDLMRRFNDVGEIKKIVI